MLVALAEAHQVEHEKGGERDLGQSDPLQIRKGDDVSLVNRKSRSELLLRMLWLPRAKSTAVIS